MFISAIERQATAEPASTCTPIAIVEGDAAVVDVVRSKLKGQGIAVTPKQDCPSVKAHVTQSESGIVLRVEDAFGRKSERTVIGPEAAAAIIGGRASLLRGAGPVAARRPAAARRFGSTSS